MNFNLNYRKLIARTRGGAIIGLIFLLSVYLGRYTTCIVSALLFWYGAKEFIKMAHLSNIDPLNNRLRFAVMACFVGALFSKAYLDLALAVSIVLMAISHVVRASRRKSHDLNFANLSTTVFCLIYAGWLPAHFILLRYLGGTDIYSLEFAQTGFMDFSYLSLILHEPGLYYCCLIAGSIFTNDIMSYFGGKLLGRVPVSFISPNKTLEGSIIGIICGTVFFGLWGLYGSEYFKIDYIHFSNTVHVIIFILLGVILNIIAQLGDLLESLQKRSAGVKDSGYIIEGAGGVLDRFDSHILVMVIAYYAFAFWSGTI